MKFLLKKQKNYRGSIALISVLIISAITLIAVIGMSEVNISTSYQYLNNKSNKSAYYLAEACLEEGIIRLERDSSFVSDVLNFNGDSCTVSVSGTTINITVEYADYVQNYEAQVSITQIGEAINVKLLDWQEV